MAKNPVSDDEKKTFGFALVTTVVPLAMPGFAFQVIFYF